MKSPLISVLIPTYNRVAYLKECLNSVLRQTWFKKNEIEILIWDNSEWNETKELINTFLKKENLYNIKYIKNEKNMWSTRNTNNLLDLSNWVYYIILSDDDKFYDKNSLKLLYDHLIKYNLDVCYWKYRVINWEWKDLWDFKPHTKIWKKKIYYDSFEEQMLQHSISFGWILYRKFWYKYDYWSKWFWDWTMNLQYLHDKKIVALINEYTLYYRVHNSNDSWGIPRNFWLKFLFYRCSYFKSYRFFFWAILKSVKWKLRKLLDIWGINTSFEI